MQQNPDEIFPEGVKLRNFEDTDSLRDSIYDGIQEELTNSFPRSHGGVRVELSDLNYHDKPNYSISEQKKAILQNKYLHRRLRGTLKLYDEETGDLLEEKPNMTLMRVPYYSNRGTFIHNGNEYSIINQARLDSGIYSRKKSNGDIEAQINAERGHGKGFRIRLEPSTGLFKLDIGQSSLHLYSLFKDIGVSDDEMRKMWGDEVFELNSKKYDIRVLPKAYDRLLGRKANAEATPQERAEAVRDAINSTMVKTNILEKTLPQAFQD
jgi:DNA-directed RNA polymerase beta subunit